MSELNNEQFDAKLAALETEAAAEGAGPSSDATPPVETPPVETKPEVTPSVTAPTPESAKPALGKDGQPIPPVTPVTPEYVPNKTYSVHGKTFEFDPKFHPLLKDKAAEDKLRTIMCKADGLDAVVHSRDSWKSQFEVAAKDLDTIAPARALYDKACDYLKKGDEANY